MAKKSAKRSAGKKAKKTAPARTKKKAVAKKRKAPVKSIHKAARKHTASSPKKGTAKAGSTSRKVAAPSLRSGKEEETKRPREKPVRTETAPVPEALRDDGLARKNHQTPLPEFSAEEKLTALFNLQQIDSEIDKIRTVRGELPLEVQDLDDEIQGFETRVSNFNAEIKKLEEACALKKNEITDAKAAIKRYENQQKNVRNNREYDSLSKEIEFQNLEIQIAEKRIKENQVLIDEKKEQIAQTKEILKERNDDLNHKKKELEEIISETKKEEEKLYAVLTKAEKIIEERLLSAYKRIRANARNGLAVVKVQRDACGGCFNKIPPQRQLDIRLHKKIIVCEHCGRILVDEEIALRAREQ